MKSKENKNGKGKYIAIFALLLVPFISIFLIIQYRHIFAPTNDEIIDYILESEGYKSNVEYTVINSKGEFKEDVEMYYKKQYGFRVEFPEERVKIYKDGYISIIENDYEYELNEGFDTLYPLGFISNILKNEITEVKEGTEEWGDIKYLEFCINLSSKNKHLSKAKVYINKEDKSPIVTKIYNSDGEESVIIVYDDFSYLDNIDKNLF